ncbi:ZIP family metal transporter [Xylanibacillus composti]|uniref:ZIP family metal transporter n=1 Tax=Xylanibacillus composti TaxID=1572762 RepID=A0A8J4GYY6_9BACL|nr:ZIP family metal transporter [Xylanibacillus composti]MDT9723922.1 ZIP family metal transporter [Xylanibacillus composti]GIQ67802.1 ZIP family metal transporter [Xylanibacillus composti]
MGSISFEIGAAAMATAIGALPVMALRHLSHRGKDILLAYTAGIMVAASTYGLIPSAMKLSNFYVLTIGILLGTLVLTLLELLLPHADFDHARPVLDESRAVLFLVAMGIHNLPEGLSVGVSYASGDAELGTLVSFAIGVQNVPEGFLIALFLITQQISRVKAFLLTALTGVLEWAAALAGLHFSESFHGIVPYGLAFAAGAMLFVVYKELIPESHGDGHERSATFAFILGLLFMIGLTHWLR